VVAFNSMLGELETGTAQLKKYQAGLEEEVVVRTAELGTALEEAQQPLNETASTIAAAEAEFEIVRRELQNMSTAAPAKQMTGA
jgi:multidrug resistance efflux pump